MYIGVKIKFLRDLKNPVTHTWYCTVQRTADKRTRYQIHVESYTLFVLYGRYVQYHVFFVFPSPRMTHEAAKEDTGTGS